MSISCDYNTRIADDWCAWERHMKTINIKLFRQWQSLCYESYLCDKTLLIFNNTVTKTQAKTNNHDTLCHPPLRFVTLVAWYIFFICSHYQIQFLNTVISRWKQWVVTLVSLLIYGPSSHLIRIDRCHGPLARYAKLRLRMRRECRERFPRHRR